MYQALLNNYSALLDLKSVLQLINDSTSVSIHLSLTIFVGWPYHIPYYPALSTTQPLRSCSRFTNRCPSYKEDPLILFMLPANNLNLQFSLLFPSSTLVGKYALTSSCFSKIIILSKAVKWFLPTLPTSTYTNLMSSFLRLNSSNASLFYRIFNKKWIYPLHSLSLVNRYNSFDRPLRS